ncbi:MAG: DUF370 domain-containing protein [Ruminococcus sp.]|jgi:hypothetical protein|nr:DUF370 domain-containing protein [Ruminococcus sp.]
MYLGENIYIKNADIIGIFDIEKTSTQADTKNYLSRLKKKAVTITYEMPKSFVVTRDKTYISEKSVITLKSRLRNLY